MTRPILVTGGTGRLGRHVVSRLVDAGRDVRVISRHSHDSTPGLEYVTGDLVSGEGIEAAVAGTEVVIHCGASVKPADDQAQVRNLVAAASRAGVRHLLYISVVGADRVPVASRVDRMMFAYFESKLASERLISGSGLPWTTLRATQFHDLVLLVAEAMAKLPVIPVPSGVRFQPVDADDVAAQFVELALGEPMGLAPDIAGPRVYPMADLLRSYLDPRGKHRLMVPLRLPGKAARAVRAGANLAPDRAVGRTTWEEFLADKLG